MDIYHEIAAGMIVWIITGIIAKLASKLPIIRDWIAQHPIIRELMMMVIVSGLVTSTMLVVYARYVAGWLEVRPVTQTEQRINSNTINCPPGSVLVGLAFQDEPGLAHGALWGPSAVCQKLELNLQTK